MAAHDGRYVRACLVCMFRAENIIQCALIRDRQSTGSPGFEFGAAEAAPSSNFLHTPAIECNV